MPAGTGHIEGTEIVDDGSFLGSTGALCLIENKSIYGLRGVGSYKGKTPSGQEVVYQAAVDPGQPVFANGPLQVQVENIDTYYMDPFGTHGIDSTCSAATVGDPVPAEFRIFAADHVYRLDAGGAQVPCVGHGSFARGDKTDPYNGGLKVDAAWALDADCTVIGNPAGTPGTGIAPADSPHTYAGQHDPCFSGSCSSNIRVDYNQYFPFEGLYVSMAGPSSAQVATAITVTAGVTNDGVALPNAPVDFAVAGPTPAAPPGGAAVTAADGTASFTFNAADVGDYTVTATATNAGATSLPPPSASGTFTVHVTELPPPPQPAMALDGATRWHTEDPVTLTATFTDANKPLPGAEVAFTVAGPTAWQGAAEGQASPASGSATTDQNGQARFSFSAGRAGDYTVTASSTSPGLTASATHVVDLDIKTLRQAGSVPSNAQFLTRSAPGIMDPAGRYAYLGRNGLQKVDLSTFQPAGYLSKNFDAAVIDPAGNYAYLGYANQVLKIDLNTMQQVAAITLSAAESGAYSAVIDPAGRYAYFGTQNMDQFQTQLPGRVIKVDLQTFQRVDAITLPAVETMLVAAVMDPAGRYAYFASSSSDQTGRLVKIDLATFTRVGAATLDGKFEASVRSAVMDPGGHYAYVGTQAAPSPFPRVVKVDLDRLQRVGAISLDSKSVDVAAAVMDPAGRFAYFGAAQRVTTTTPATVSQAPGPSAVLKVDLSSFQVAETAYLPAGEVGDLVAGVIDPAGNFAYFGKKAVPSDSTGTSQSYPASVVKVALSRSPKAELVAGGDSYSTPYVTPLSVPAPGVLANDADTGDGDPLTAGQASDPAHGTVALDPSGSFTYTPDAGFSGTDTFTYTASDAMDYSAPATVAIAVGPRPAGVSAVSGGAAGYFTNVSLFGGAASTRGPAPSVSLAPTGGSQSATDPDGDTASYGPARIFENHGAITVATQGTTGPAGSATSSASVHDISDNDPFHAHAPDGEASSTCTATEAGLSASARIVNGRLVTSTDPNNGDPVTQVVFPSTWDPAPNTTYDGALTHIGDRFRMVFNEQILGPDSITVNAVHLYLLGPTAVGDMIIGQSRCGVELATPNAAPVANDDAYTTTSGRALVVGASGVLGNDTDPEGRPLTATTAAPIRPPASGGGAWTFPSDPAHGTLALSADGGFTYTPAPGYVGPDSFTYVANDARGKSDTATVTIAVTAAARRAVADFDGNGTSDRSVFRSGAWYAESQPTAFFGIAGDIAVPGDYDGDGRIDRAVYRAGAWLTEGQAPAYLGLADDIPVPGDFDGDGDTDRAVFRPSVGAWFVDGQPTVYLGATGDIPVPGDYDGDGDTDRGVWRPSVGAWYIDGQATQWIGLNGDIPVPGDYDGDGDTDRGIWRPAYGAWYIDGQATSWIGLQGDVPVPGDYDGNGTTEVGIWRPGVGGWHVDGQAPVYLGAFGDVPLPLPAAIHRAFFT